MKPVTAAIVPLVFATLAPNCGMHKDYDGHGGEAGNGDPDAGAPSVGGSVAQGGTAGSGEGGSSAVGGVGVSGGAGGDTCGTNATAGCAGEATGGSGGDVTPAITAVAWIQPDSCERSVPYEVRDVRDQDGAPVTDYTCEWTFSDGAVVDTCAGSRIFGELPRSHDGTVVVRDSVTGATTTATSDYVTMIEPQGIEIFATSYECMRFTYDIDRQYGCGGTHVFDIQPAENIVTPGPWSREAQTLEISTPGVYTLSYTIEGCAPQYARTCITNHTVRVTVEACP
jgi:hypothetical protein